MTTVQIKKQIIQKLQSIDDFSFLEAVNRIIDAKTNEEIFYINEDLEKQLTERDKNMDAGHSITNDDVFNESEEWLNER
ncbi:MAG: hypothetical protein K9J27_05780 [Bacteroidales bacterium]|nr:hypothetical protein [Bacteroidales bacterium]MCF8334755.1 hypothetical protein [Bacteroidales bacterium]